MDHQTATQNNQAITGGTLANRYFILICFIGLCLNFAMNIFNNAITLYLSSLGGGTSISGMIAIPFAVAAIVARLIGGYSTDHIGRRAVLVAGSMIFALGALPFGLVANFAALFLLRALHGFGYSITNTALSAATMDTSPPEKASAASGFFYLPTALSLAVCGVITIFFTNRNQFSVLFLIVGSVLLCGAVLAFLCNYEKKVRFHAGADKKDEAVYHGLQRFFEVSALPAAIITILFDISTCYLNGFLLLFAVEKSIPQSGLFFTISAVVMLVLNLNANWIQSVFGRLPIVLFASVILSVAFFWMAMTGSAVAYFFTAFAYAFASGAAFPVLYLLALEEARPERRGAASCTILMANDIGVGIGSALWGVLISEIGFSGSMFCCAAVLFVTAVTAYLFLHGKK